MTAIFLDILQKSEYSIYGGGDVRTEKTDSVAISDFLARSKNLLAAGRYIFVPRGKNLHALAVNGLTIADAKREIMDLIVEDYYKGPKQDFDANQPGDIWEFKKDIDGEIFYVKLKIQNVNGKDILKCLSFHEDNFR